MSAMGTARKQPRHAMLEQRWQASFDALKAAGLNGSEDHPVAKAYRDASDAVNHSNRSRDYDIATHNPHIDGSVHTFHPTGMDAWDRRPHQPAPGQRVRVVQPKGVPRNGTMGHVYVEDAETGNFHGLVLKASLHPVKE